MSGEQESAARRKSAEFQEMPGEAEANAVRDAFLEGAGSNPSDVASALTHADGASRARALSRLQQEQGNAYVQRIGPRHTTLDQIGKNNCPNART